MEKLKKIASFVSGLGNLEQDYLFMIHEEEVSLRDKFHPFMMEVDYHRASDSINGEYIHPINYFLQQEGMAKLWKGRNGANFGGSGGNQGPVEAKTDKTPVVEEKKEEEVELNEKEIGA